MYKKAYQKVKQHGFWLWEHNNFAMNFDKLILANLVGEVMEEIVEWINNLWIIC